jgi:hypothetical protein
MGRSFRVCTPPELIKGRLASASGLRKCASGTLIRQGPAVLLPCLRRSLRALAGLAIDNQFPAFGFGKASRISAAVVRPPCSLTILLKKTTPCRSIKNVEGYAVSWGASHRRP